MVATQKLTRRFYQRTLPTFLVSVLAGILIVQYFFPIPYGKELYSELTAWGTIITTVTFVFANVSIFVMHTRRILLRKATTRLLFNSAVLLSGFFAIILIYILVPGGRTSIIMTQWQYYMIGFAQMGMRADWAWHPYTSFRMMRITSLESGLFVVSWILSCLQQLPLWTSFVPAFGPIGDWIGSIPMTAAQRAGLACSGVSSVILAVRAVAGREPGLIEVEVT